MSDGKLTPEEYHAMTGEWPPGLEPETDAEKQERERVRDALTKLRQEYEELMQDE